MSEQTQTYQCPSCGAPLHFDAKLQKLKCDSCGNTYSIEEIGRYLDEKQEEPASVEDNELHWSEEEQSHLKAYSCPACGAQLMSDDTTVASFCPYCGNNAIIAERAEGSLRPNYLIPFQKTKEEALQTLKDFYKGRPFLLKTFREENHLEEIRGIYVPFWLYDTSAHANLQYHATRVRTHASGDDIITLTDHYAVGRQSETHFTKIPADASSSMPDILMDSIEPFDYRHLTSFDLSYLPGYLADRYDVTSDADRSRIEKRVRDTAINKTKRTIIGYATLMPVYENVQIRQDALFYAFLPVWLLSTKYHGKNYLFAMNGETGKMAADPLPVSKMKFIVTFLIIAAAGILIAYLIAF